VILYSEFTVLRIGASCRQTTIFSVFALGSGLK
jgi:hypothetical protein